MRRSSTLWCSAVLVSLFCACNSDEQDSSNDVGGVLGPAVAIGEHALILRPQDDSALLVDATASVADGNGVTRVVLPANPAWLAEREGVDEALVLSEGRRGVNEPAVLSVVDADGALRNYEVGAPFTGLAQDGSGDVAVLYFRQGAETVLFSPNEIAVVDLDGEQVTRRSLPTEGGAPLDVIVSPTLSVGDGSVQLAVVLTRAYVTLLDVERPMRAPITVQLSQATGDAATVPTRVAFSRERGQLFVVGEGSDDLFVLTLGPPAEDADNRFGVQVEQLAAAAPSDVLAFEDAGAQAWVTAPGSAQLLALNVGDRSRQTVELSSPASELLGYVGNDGIQRALLFSVGSDMVTFADAESIADSTRLETLQLAQPVQRAVDLVEQGRVIFEHGDATLSVVDVWNRNSALLSANGSLDNAVYDEQLGSVWLARPSDNLVGVLSLAGGQPREVLLERPVERLLTVPAAGRVVAVHNSPEPSLTLLDAADPDFEQALILEDLP